MTEEKQTTSSNKLSWLGGGALVIAIVAAIIAILAWAHMSHTINRMDNKYHGLLFNFEKVQKQQQKSIQQQNQSLMTYEETLQKLINKKNQTSSKWDLSQAVYLTHLANYKLLLEHDPKTATFILNLIKKRLTVRDGLGDSSAIKAIDSDIKKLENAPHPNISRMYTRLAAYTMQLPNMPLASNQNIKVKQDKVITKEHKTKTWSQSLENSWQQLKSLVSVKHDDGEASAKLTTTQSLYLYLDLHSMLIQAEFALLHRENAIFHQNINLMIDWINQYFLLSSNKVQSLLALLKSYQKININPKLPSLNDSMSAILKLQQQEANKK